MVALAAFSFQIFLKRDCHSVHCSAVDQPDNAINEKTVNGSKKVVGKSPWSSDALSHNVLRSVHEEMTTGKFVGNAARRDVLVSKIPSGGGFLILCREGSVGIGNLRLLHSALSPISSLPPLFGSLDIY